MGGKLPAFDKKITVRLGWIGAYAHWITNQFFLTVHIVLMQNLFRPFNKVITFVVGQLNRMPRWSQHILFWAVLSLMTRNQFVRMYSIGADGTSPNPTGFWVLWPSHLLFSMAAFYVLGYYVVPRFWKRNGGIQFLALFALYWELSYLQMKWIFEFVLANFAPAPPYLATRLAKLEALPWHSGFTDAETFFMNWAYNFSYVIIPLLIKAKRDETSKAERMLSLEQEKRNMEQEKMNMEQEKMNMELSFLKAQINPHFLFNAFNNLYTLILKGDQQASMILADLSEVMRYALYRTSEQYVPLTNELKFLANYVRLESIRFAKSKTITAFVTGDPAGWLIPPMIIVTFMENAVKHGLNKSIGNAWVTYAIDIEPEGTFHLTIRNSKGKVIHSSGEGGIGIVNVRKRLDLLMKDQYKLVLSDEPDEFSVRFTLPLRRATESTPVYEVVDHPDLEPTKPAPTQKTITDDQLSYR
jgi:two-component system LytT family sensor kinase